MTTTRRKLAVLASGRGSNFRAILQSCLKDDFPAEVVCLITDNPEAGAIAIAEEFDVPVHIVDAGSRRGRLQEGAEADIVEQLRARDVEFVFLAGFMRIVGEELLAAFPDRILNVHPSLLPAFKGLRAPEQAIAYGARVSGCTVHFVDDSVDGGAIVLQEAVAIREGDTPESLQERIQLAEHRVVPRAIALLATDALHINGRRVTGAE